MKNLWIIAAALSVLAACGNEEAEAPVPEPASTTVPAPPAPAAPAAEAQAAPAAPSAPAPAGAVSVADLRAGFEASQSEWVGREITLTGVYLNATSVGGTVNNISILASREDDMMNSIVCGFGANAPASVTLTQYSPVTVRGTVRERFRRPALENCTIE